MSCRFISCDALCKLVSGATDRIHFCAFGLCLDCVRKIGDPFPPVRNGIPMKVMSTVSILSVLLGGAFAPGKKTQKVHLTIRCFGVTVWVYMNFHSALPPPLPYSNLEPLPGFVAEIMMVTCLHLVGCPG